MQTARWAQTAAILLGVWRRRAAVRPRVWWLQGLLLVLPLLSGCAYDEPDAPPPTAAVSFPGPVALFTTRNVTLRGTAQSQHAIARITVNGVPATSTDGFATWVARLTLPPGRHAVVVSTEDVWGHRDVAAATATVVVGALLREPRGMALEASGHLVVADSALRAVICLDPVTGASAIVADGTTCPATPFRSPADIAVEARGDLIVADRLVGVIRVDPVSGACVVVSEVSEGGGPRAESIVIEADGRWLVISGSTLVRVDPVSGQRTVLWDASTMRGEPPFMPHDLLVDPLGQVVVTNQVYPSASVVQVDPQSGQRTVLSGPRLALLEGVGFVTESLIGSGPLFGLPAGIALEASGQLVVVDSGRRAVFRVDPRSGDRIILSDDTTGRGPLFASPEGIVVAADGQLLVTDRAHGTVIRVEPASGDRTMLQFETGLGGGPALAAPSGIAVEAHGVVVVADGFDQRTQQGGLQAVVRVNPLTGDRTVVSDSQTGEGPLFLTPADIAVEGDGQFVVVDRRGGAVLRVEPGSGRRTVLADAVTGSGPFVQRPTGIVVEPSGHLVVVGVTECAGDLFGAVLRVDPVSGVRTRVDLIDETGGRLVAPRDIARDSRAQWVILDFDRILRLDPATGRVTTVSDILRLALPFGSAEPVTLAVEASGHILLVDQGRRAVIRIDPITGEQAVMSDATTGSGPLFVTPRALAIGLDGQVVVTDTGLRAVLRIDAQSGDRAIISK